MSLFDDLPGTPLPPGSITIPAAESADLAQVLGSAAPDGGRLHPLYGYIAAQRGIGISIPDLCRLAEFDIDDGPMLGSLSIELRGDLHADTEYAVDGEVLSIVRKHGRTGTFDLMTFQERLTSPGGEVVTVAEVSFVLPRREVTA